MPLLNDPIRITSLALPESVYIPAKDYTLRNKIHFKDLVAMALREFLSKHKGSTPAATNLNLKMPT